MPDEDLERGLFWEFMLGYGLLACVGPSFLGHKFLFLGTKPHDFGNV
jgi:hypothetical protein